jgi:hypothetical protein
LLLSALNSGREYNIPGPPIHSLIAKTIWTSTDLASYPLSAGGDANAHGSTAYPADLVIDEEGDQSGSQKRT